MAAEINQKENDMQLLIDGYQVQIVFPPNSTTNKAANIIEELQNILLTTYLKWRWIKDYTEIYTKKFDEDLILWDTIKSSLTIKRIFCILWFFEFKSRSIERKNNICSLITN